LKEREELATIIGGALRKSASKHLNEKRENESRGLLSVERGEVRGDWFQGFGVVPHRRMTT